MWSRILQNVQKHNKTFKLYVFGPFLGLSKVGLLCLQALNILALFLVPIPILNLHNPTLPLFDVSPLTGYHKSRTSVSQTLTFLTADITLGNYATPCVIKSGDDQVLKCVWSSCYRWGRPWVWSMCPIGPIPNWVMAAMWELCMANGSSLSLWISSSRFLTWTV